MYGKVFSKMYEGSMVGAGIPVFALWPYCISKADPSDHTVELNPALLSAVLGATKEDIASAIEFLCSPDPDSHCDDHDGARIVKQQGFTYLVTTHQHYQKINTKEARTEYYREQKRKQRAKNKNDKGEEPEEPEENDDTPADETKIDWKLVQAHWNSIAESVGLANIKSMTNTRKAHYRQRTDQGRSQDEFWAVVDRECRRLKPFALGLDDDRDWKMSFDYIIGSATKFTKLAEGVFRKPQAKKQPPRKRIDV